MAVSDRRGVDFNSPFFAAETFHCISKTLYNKCFLAFPFYSINIMEMRKQNQYQVFTSEVNSLLRKKPSQAVDSPFFMWY